MNTKKVIYLILLCVVGLLTSCGGSKKAVSSTRKQQVETKITRVERTTQEIKPEKSLEKVEIQKPSIEPTSYHDKVAQYIFEFSEIAKLEMKIYKIPASITLAQGILESGAGYGELTQKANNHFGIKCHDWQGDTVHHDDDLDQECFRKYDLASESFRDHSLFLTERKRYSRLFTFSPKDYKSWARGLKEAGYATDVKYPQKLIAIIERYQLYKFDKEVLGKQKVEQRKTPVKPKRTFTNKKNHIVKKGDTLYSISRKYKISVNELRALNNLSGNTIKVGQVLKTKDSEEEEDFN